MASEPIAVTGVEQTAPRGIVVQSAFWRRVLTFLVVFGPGLIVTAADNDAGGVSTYTQAGAQYGLELLWVLIVLLPVTYFIQEMVVRLGIATGKGHATMIYQRFGRFWGAFSLFDLQLVNFMTLITEFAAISLAFAALGASPYLSVPVAAVCLVALVITGSYLRWERITIILCFFDAAWYVFALVAHPDVGEVTRNALVPHIPEKGLSADLVFLVIALVGTTIAPWQLFFQQSAVADKRLRFSDLKWERLDTFLGATFTILVAGCMMIVGNVMHTAGLEFQDPAQMAVALGPILGPVIRYGVPLLFVNAAVLGTTAISLASSWAYCEVRGWPHSLQLPFHQARGFYLTYVTATGLAAGIVLIPGLPLELVIIAVQVLAGLMLPSAIVFLQLLLNDHELLGERFLNRRWNNVVNWTIIVVLFILSGALAVQVLLPNVVGSGMGS